MRRFQPGDEVFGQTLVANLWRHGGVRDEGRIQAGHRVLINGAGDAVGTFAVQLAKALGADVTAVDAAEKLEMLRAIGADRVVDYGREISPGATRDGHVPETV